VKYLADIAVQSDNIHLGAFSIDKSLGIEFGGSSGDAGCLIRANLEENLKSGHDGQSESKSCNPPSIIGNSVLGRNVGAGGVAALAYCLLIRWWQG